MTIKHDKYNSSITWYLKASTTSISYQLYVYGAPLKNSFVSRLDIALILFQTNCALVAAAVFAAAFSFDHITSLEYAEVDT